SVTLKKLVDHSILIASYCAPRRDAQVSRVHGCAGATLALHHHKRTLHAVQLIFLGSQQNIGESCHPLRG
ncbi:MAG: hypothetical protein P8163_06905, partial [Candidatus Thiodiazotropha sp.]